MLTWGFLSVSNPDTPQSQESHSPKEGKLGANFLSRSSGGAHISKGRKKFCHDLERNYRFGVF